VPILSVCLLVTQSGQFSRLKPKRTWQIRLYDYLIGRFDGGECHAPGLSHRVGCARVFEPGGDAQEPVCPLAILRPSVGGCTP